MQRFRILVAALSVMLAVGTSVQGDGIVKLVSVCHTNCININDFHCLAYVHVCLKGDNFVASAATVYEAPELPNDTVKSCTFEVHEVWLHKAINKS